MSSRPFRPAARPIAVLMALTFVVAGCSLAPKYERPAAPIPSLYPGQTGVGEVDARTLDAMTSSDLGWREFFRDPRLIALLELALVNNRDLRIALDSVEEARALYGITNSNRLPNVGVGANIQVTRSPEELRMVGTESVSRFYQAGVGLTAFELDFFGRIKNLSEAAYQQYLATAQGRRTVHLNLVAAVAEAYFRLRTSEDLEVLIQKTLRSREETLALVRARFNAGVASELDTYQARSQLDSVRADLAAIRRAKAQSKNALQLLIGIEEPANLPKPAIFGRDQLLAAIPVGLPSELLVRRPDIMAAENVLLGANASIGAARAAFFPNISITGMLGFASPQLGGLFSGGNRFWQYAPQLQMPIFSGGSVRSNLDLAKARKNIAVSQYEKAIQTAFREVADSLAGEATYTGQLNALRSLQDSASQSLRLARLRYQTGIDSFLQVQTAEVNFYAAQQALIQTGLESLLNRVELYKALGGGWLEETSTGKVPVTAEGAVGSIKGSHPGGQTPPKGR